MRQRSWLFRLVGLVTWTVLIELALAFFLRWRGRGNSQKADPKNIDYFDENGPDTGGWVRSGPSLENAAPRAERRIVRSTTQHSRRLAAVQYCSSPALTGG